MIGTEASVRSSKSMKISKSTDNVKKLIGPQATLANIRDALEVWLPSKVQESDRVVVFFVGHGVTDKDGHGYLAPYDIDPRHSSRPFAPRL